jgi:hypothetical protein
MLVAAIQYAKYEAALEDANGHIQVLRTSDREDVEKIKIPTGSTFALWIGKDCVLVFENGEEELYADDILPFGLWD